MTLPFFKKSKDKAPGSAQKTAPAPAHAMDAPPTESLFTMNMGASGIVVEETSGSPQSLVDEAAILYASGQAETVEHLLKDILAKGDRRAWLMLFDLYGIQNREKEFEQLALDYAMRFETSPPVWQKIGGNDAAKPQQAQTTSLELPGLLDKKAAATLRQGIAATAKNAVVRIDFSGIAMVDEAGADECAQILAAARKAKRKLQVSGVDRLIALLQDLNRATHSRAVHWLLLLELYQTLGQEENFEDLAVDYAVRFEVSPPSWSEVHAAEVVQAAPAEPRDDALRLSGEITPANDSALQQFGSYAATHNDVLVDLTQVTRVDYGSVSQFISVLMQCLGSGKTITLRGHNALIHELFRVMGIDQLAQLVPHHPD
ncbi:MAG: STAS domain-containing protein [Thiobacillus sp.]|nr:STAS domain-containing protein [Thiobacillus sp.]